MKKTIISLFAMLVLTLSSQTFAKECDPGFQPDYPAGTEGTFSTDQFKKANKPPEDSAGSVMMCFMGSSQPGMSPTKIFNDTCGCKEEIKKHCSLSKKGKIKAKGVPKAWCAPFAPFL
jgi:hypothetical protein